MNDIGTHSEAASRACVARAEWRDRYLSSPFLNQTLYNSRSCMALIASNRHRQCLDWLTLWPTDLALECSRFVSMGSTVPCGASDVKPRDTRDSQVW